MGEKTIPTDSSILFQRLGVDTARRIANDLTVITDAARAGRLGWVAPSEEWWLDGEPMTTAAQIVTEAMCRAALLPHCPRCVSKET